MTILLALISFAVVMIVLSTLVVAVVEILHEVRGMRRRHLRYFLGAVFDEYLWPNLGALVCSPRIEPARARATADMAALARRRDRLGKLMAVLDPGTMLGRRSTATLGRDYAMMSGAVWVVILLGSGVLVVSGWAILVPVLLVVIALSVDTSRERDRQTLPGLGNLRPERAALLWSLAEAMLERDRLEAIPAAERPAEASQTLAALRERIEAAGEDDRQTARRMKLRQSFIDELVRASESINAGAGGAGVGRTSIPTTVFVAQIARSEFGAALRMAARDRIDILVTDLARRYDRLGAESSQTFREMSRRWSVIAAFAVALLVNVDAVRLFDALYRDPALAARVEATFATRLEDMSQAAARLEATLDQPAATPPATSPSTAAPLTAPVAAPDPEAARRELDALKQRIEALRTQTAGTTAELEGLGVPVGWRHFPFCLPGAEIVAGFTPPPVDPACAVMAARAEAAIRAASTVVPGTGPDRFTYGGLLDASLARPFLIDGRPVPCPGSREGTCTIADYRPAFHEAPAAFLRAARVRAGAYVEAGRMWWAARGDGALMSWAAGVLLAGALIGLGGPFWFDIYRRLSAFAEVARAFGLRGQPRSPADAAASPPGDPETVHRPANVVEAFTLTEAAQARLDSVRAEEASFALLAEMAEAEAEPDGEADMPRPRPVRRLLDAEGRPQPGDLP